MPDNESQLGVITTQIWEDLSHLFLGMEVNTVQPSRNPSEITFVDGELLEYYRYAALAEGSEDTSEAQESGPKNGVGSVRRFGNLNGVFVLEGIPYHLDTTIQTDKHERWKWDKGELEKLGQEFSGHEPKYTVIVNSKIKIIRTTKFMRPMAASENTEAE
ncbi:LOW QUALITY PROTEIN: hypothetical protein T265_12541 [Opisthorchis viverrini]|uniref:Uncharacterized protein n=1 Tax=Opisthorchis viverrini TaxID=6198 RepID=A0A075A341_OPIVI|nr:LOW QUALITY PROTEIN: hypothetical protein T265_12541 [Opisthorchis viverrini]KER33771.1 LOW QUALITY PROTEIN: hypothetical protein T265_12541 [Opisthorchis viverrini]